MTSLREYYDGGKQYLKKNGTELAIISISELVKLGLMERYQGKNAVNQLKDQNYKTHSKLANNEDVAKIAVTLALDYFGPKRNYHLSD